MFPEHFLIRVMHDKQAEILNVTTANRLIRQAAEAKRKPHTPRFSIRALFRNGFALLIELGKPVDAGSSQQIEISHQYNRLASDRSSRKPAHSHYEDFNN